MLSLGPVQVLGEDLTHFLFSSKCLSTLREYSLPRELLEKHIFSLTKGSANGPWCQKFEVKPVTVEVSLAYLFLKKDFFSLERILRDYVELVHLVTSYCQMRRRQLSIILHAMKQKWHLYALVSKSLINWSCSFKTYFLKTFTARNVLLIQNIKKRNRGRGRISE